ncbi:hydroxyphenylacetyl-CoA thioesterase PaaI [Cryptosporangium aurantiacum]|uniref:Acyl-CoA thioesterase n=1 Tax=Cryptosporangium aurantiacum TaxID=134849 RepID=A0A1M7RNQ9_9ACTN|nr:hydroxyphenylacetyl-CoA thioesterase PaaI [Cryptosporangium aurantiacum]SHN47732.1 acyl-CoA thioesterase [Cryptosporangium aurantiacum]
MPDAEDVARRSAKLMLAGDDASRALGITLEAVGPGTAEVSMTVRPDMTNGWDLCHGGLIATLADTAFAVACNSHGEVTVAAGFDVTFLESGRAGDRLLARAVERASRGRSGLYDVTVFRLFPDGTPGDVLAEFRGRSRSLGRPIPGL